MRVFAVVFVVCVATAMSTDIGPEMTKIAEECAKEYNVDLSALTPDKKPDPEMFKTKEFKCFGKCYCVKAGLCSEAGEPNIEKIKEMFNPDESAMGHIKTCSEENKQEDTCDRVSAIHECIMKNIKG